MMSHLSLNSGTRYVATGMVRIGGPIRIWQKTLGNSGSKYFLKARVQHFLKGAVYPDKSHWTDYLKS